MASLDDEPAEPFERIRHSWRRGKRHSARKKEEYVRECMGKTRYHTRSDGEMEQARAMERTGDDFTLYQCRHCGFYHIGHTYARKIPGVAR